MEWTLDLLTCGQTQQKYLLTLLLKISDRLSSITFHDLLLVIFFSFMMDGSTDSSNNEVELVLVVFCVK